MWVLVDASGICQHLHILQQWHRVPGWQPAEVTLQLSGEGERKPCLVEIPLLNSAYMRMK